jgi:hypothetical protein
MGEWKYSSTILDLGTSGGDWSASSPGRFTPWESPPVPIEFVTGKLFSRLALIQTPAVASALVLKRTAYVLLNSHFSSQVTILKH